MDPLLDDTICFARKMKEAKGDNVRCVELLDNLPHGFLNFTLVSKDCMEGSKTCIRHLRAAFGMPIQE